MSWTDRQRRAIDAVGRDILVSAGAGSGKTAVLAERCAHLVSEADPRCDVDRLLVVTFTEAAAEEMRARIGRALRERMKHGRGGHRLREQLARLDLASVSTLHAFCLRTLRRHFAAAELDPAATVLDAADAVTLRDETLRTLFDDLTVADTEKARAFDEFRHQYGHGQDERIRELVLSVSEFLGSLPDPEAWRRRVLARYVSPAAGRLSDEWREARREMLVDLLEEPHYALECVRQQFATAPAAKAWVAYADELATVIEAWLAKLGRGGPAEVENVCAEMAAFKPNRAPTRSKEIKALPAEELACFDSASEAVGAARGSLKKVIASEARYSEQDWAEGLARVAPHVAHLLWLAEKFDERYTAAKAALRVLDFPDLERRMLRLLRESPETARRLRDQFEHILVDEYQDINPIQDELLRLISRDADPHRPGNLFRVGDVKQSIYRFRLAEPELFVRIHDAFRDEPSGREGLRVALPDNFRSQPGVLEVTNRIMARLMTRDLGGVPYDDDARLRPGVQPDAPVAEWPAMELHLLERMPSARIESDEGEDADPGDEPAADRVELELIEREAVIIGERLLQRRREQPELRWSDVAILMRSPKAQAGQAARVLGRMGIPAVADRSGGLFESREVCDVLALLAILDNAQQDIPLAAILRSSLCAAPASGGVPSLPLSDAELAAIRIEQPRGPFFEAVARYAEAGTDAGLRGRLRDLRERVARWRGVARRETAANLIDRIYSDTHYPEFVAVLPDGPQRRANLLALHEQARRFGRFARQGLPRFLRFLEELQAREEDLPGGSPPGAADDVVRLMSIHTAKGLEFPLVVLLGAGKQFNLTDAAQPIILDRRNGVGLKAVDPQRRITYPTLAHRAAARRVRDETLSEELRLLYVALTRAKRQLFVVGHAPREAIDALAVPAPVAAGPLPAPQRRRARGMLDWILAALCAEPPGTVAFDQKKPALVVAFRHAPPRHMDEAATLDESKWSDGLGAASRLEPLPGVPVPSRAALQEARIVIERLERGYPGDLLTRVPSIVAVSELKRRWVMSEDPEAPAVRTTSPGVRPGLNFDWPRPRCAAEAIPSAVHRGTLTHLFLQHADFSASCDSSDLKRQRDEMAVRGLFSEADARQIDLEAIAWYLAEPPGRDLRAAVGTLRREMPFTLAVPSTRHSGDAPPLDADDFLVVRGIIDVMYETPAGLVLLDWKTDSGSAELIDERVALYAPQLDIYAHAAAEMFGRPIVKRRLVFLTVRRIADV